MDYLQQIFERISHSLRSPLGVAQQTLNDAAAGMELSQEDFSDARASLSKIVANLDYLKSLGSGDPKPSADQKINFAATLIADYLKRRDIMLDHFIVKDRKLICYLKGFEANNLLDFIVKDQGIFSISALYGLYLLESQGVLLVVERVKS
ncbi:hypothetical protein JNK13_08345 [bacterium]|nr:hypothetical protein [bacterium]